MTKPKTISFIPSPDLEKRIEKLTDRLRTSKSGLTELALDFVTARLTKGTAHVVNGQIVLDPQAETQAA